VFAIDGMGGVGKTALAVHLAHRIRAGFPNGQLFLDLCGHSNATAPLSPHEALGALLGQLGLPADSIPADVNARVALYRSLLDGTRTLIVLDNARVPPEYVHCCRRPHAAWSL
jgi:predicted ATPase